MAEKRGEQESRGIGKVVSRNGTEERWEEVC